MKVNQFKLPPRQIAPYCTQSMPLKVISKSSTHRIITDELLRCNSRPYTIHIGNNIATTDCMSHFEAVVGDLPEIIYIYYVYLFILVNFDQRYLRRN